MKIGKLSFSLRMCVVFVMFCIITSCSLIKVRNEAKQSLKSTVVIGLVSSEVPVDSPIIVAAYSVGAEKKVVHYSVLHDSGEFELMLEQGDYYIFAYQDKNSNLIYEKGEPAGQYGEPKKVRAASEIVYDINFIIPQDKKDIIVPYETEISSVKPEKLHSRQAGNITDLNDERFAEENGVKGFWEGLSFYKQFGGNIFFLEEYDPEKIPVLFIHGASGTPKEWQYIVDNIDRTRFQPWFFYYPSGSRIDSMSYLLLWKLSNLQAKYNFSKLYITAHSMGGLVARSFLVNYAGQFPFIKLFVSLATPWGGDRMAEYGVQHSPAIIPSWIDMQPDGDFIKSLYRIKMPEHINFYMLYGHKGSRNPFLANNDGTIALNSLLDLRAQSEAKMNYAFNEDHVTILSSKEVMTQYNTILDEFDNKSNASVNKSGGFLKINLSYDNHFGSAGHNFQPKLILHSSDNKNQEIVSFLNTNNKNKIFGPFPPGDYFANVVITEGKTDKKNVRISIENNKTKEINFSFAPDGIVLGLITAPLKQEEQFAGMPDYQFRTVDNNINIQSITLTGNGIQRTVQQLKGEHINSYNWLISRKDFSYNTFFAFLGLPAGDYQLSIKAEGYKTLIKNYSITPGTPEYFRIIELARK